MRLRRKGIAASLPRLHLSLTNPGFRLLSAAQWLLSLMTLIAVGMAAWFWWSSGSLAREAGEIERATARLQELNQQFGQQAAQAGFPVSKERIDALGREVVFANQLSEKRTFSWTRLLSDLEETVPPRVSLATVTLSFADRVITLNGASATLKDLTDFLNALGGHAAFNNAVLSHHRFREPASGGTVPASRQADNTDRLRPVEFTLTVGYRPPR